METGTKSVLRVAMIVAVSVLLGAIFATWAIFGLIVRAWVKSLIMADAPMVIITPLSVVLAFAGIAGAIVGFVMSPALVHALVGPRWRRTLMDVALLSAGTAFASGVFGPEYFQPFLALVVTALAYLVTCCVCGDRQRILMREEASHQCPSCGYSRKGLGPRAVCPECGKGPQWNVN